MYNPILSRYIETDTPRDPFKSMTHYSTLNHDSFMLGIVRRISLWGLENKMKKIEKTLSSIIAMLIDAKEKQQLPDWLEKLKDITMMLMIYWMMFNTKLL